MKLGIITDSHEHVEHLRTALNRFSAEDLDQVVVIGIYPCNEQCLSMV